MLTTIILHGDCRDILPTLEAESFDCVVTSPPYWGLRDYGVAGQIGLEPTMAAYLETMVGVCRELRRVLKPAGTFWLNIGDSYATVGGNGTQGASGQRASRTFTASGSSKKGVPDGLKPKDLCMIPNRLAIALQDEGWWVRSEIIWAKPNPMPESVTDRPTSAHEKIWLLTKSERYFYDAAAIREEFADERQGNPGAYLRTTSRAKGCIRERQDSGLLNGGGGWASGAERGGRNARNVWTIPSQPFKGSHFATFPPALVERCIKAGCPAGGSVLDPFGGAGTTGLVADRLGRHATLIELNPEYADMTKRRIDGDAGLFADATIDSGNG
jgi:DNA modification methylase